MELMSWSRKGSVLSTQTANFIPSRRVAAFDFDHTLVSTVSNRAFATHKDDFLLLHGARKSLKFLCASGYCIAIFSNQLDLKGKRESDFKHRVNRFMLETEIPFVLYAASHRDMYRKPMPGMWNMFTADFKLEPDLSLSFFCGDAAGRARDHTDTDYKLALNIGVPFHIPETFFSKEAENLIDGAMADKSDSESDIKKLKVHQGKIVTVGKNLIGSVIFISKLPKIEHPYLANMNSRFPEENGGKNEFSKYNFIVCIGPPALQAHMVKFVSESFKTYNLLQNNLFTSASMNIPDRSILNIDGLLKKQSRENWIKRATGLKLCIVFTIDTEVERHVENVIAQNSKKPKAKNVKHKGRYVVEREEVFEYPNLSEGLDCIMEIPFIPTFGDLPGDFNLIQWNYYY